MSENTSFIPKIDCAGCPSALEKNYCLTYCSTYGGHLYKEFFNDDYLFNKTNFGIGRKSFTILFYNIDASQPLLSINNLKYVSFFTEGPDYLKDKEKRYYPKYKYTVLIILGQAMLTALPWVAWKLYSSGSMQVGN